MLVYNACCIHEWLVSKRCSGFRPETGVVFCNGMTTLFVGRNYDTGSPTVFVSEPEQVRIFAARAQYCMRRALLTHQALILQAYMPKYASRHLVSEVTDRPCCFAPSIWL